MENKRKKTKRSVRKKKNIRAKGKISIRTLTEKIAELNEILPYLSVPLKKKSLEYLSDLYSETFELVMNVTAYMVQKRYCGMHDTIDNSVLKVQGLVGILKEFNTLNEEKYDFKALDDNLKAKISSLLHALNLKMSELLTLKTSTVK
jgi:hypothetical protein